MDAGNWEVFAEIVARLIGNIGFPIVCVGVMFWQSYTDRKARAEERTQWLDAINNNTAVLNKLLGKLGE